MLRSDKKSMHALEICLVIVTLGLTALLYETAGHKITVLNLYFLPVVLAGFFLGRYRAGVLALLSVVAASAIVVQDMSNFASFNSPVAALLAVTIWGAVLGLTSILVGTLNDERIAKSAEAREAHVGVVEVLARYLQSANPLLKSRAVRVAELSEKVARKMRLSSKEVDDIRIASLLVDIENIEITARVIKKAVGELGDSENHETIHGTELVRSLGQVMSGAFPLVLSREEAGEMRSEDIPFGAHILQAVRAFDELTHGEYAAARTDAATAIAELQADIEADHHPAVLHALEEVVLTDPPEPTQPARPDIAAAADELEKLLADA